MAKLIIEKWQCDRCKCIEDEKPHVSIPRVTLSASVTHDWHNEVTTFNDLCNKCNIEVIDWLKGIYKWQPK